MRIDHTGIATENTDSLVFLYEDLFGCAITHEELFDGMKVVFLELENGYFELLEPMDEEGAIARYLEDNGPGLHHVAVETDDIEGALAAARDRNVDLIDDEPRRGAWGHDVAFLHPKSTGGVLFEFVEHGGDR